MREMTDRESCILREVVSYVISVYRQSSGKGAV